jgi:diguanylate cyclase (GGDEF)-like protein
VAPEAPSNGYPEPIMSIRYKFFLAFSLLVALACALAFCGFQQVAASGDLVVRLYDGPLLGINHARSADTTLNEARLLIKLNPGGDIRNDTVTKFQTMVAEIATDLRIVHERIEDDDVKAALAKAEIRIRDWSGAELELLRFAPDGVARIPTALAVTQKGDDAATALDGLIERVTAYGYEYRKKAEAAVAAARTTLLALAIGTALLGIILAISFSYSMSKPISEAMQVAERVASGNFTDQIASHRNDELGRLLRSLAAMQSRLKARADEDYAVMEKLDVALNNMTHGLCMFGPDDRLVLWNERYVTMYGIAPGRLYVGCTLEEMLEARKSAGTAYRDLAHYNEQLQTAITTRSLDSQIAQLADGRTVNVVYRATQNGSWVSTHEDITGRMQDQARIAHLAYHDQLTGLPNRAAFRDHIARTFERASSGNESFAVLYIDLDRFKEINDVYGHAAGDRFLAEIGSRLALACDGAFLARLDGNEFTVVSSGGTQPASAQELCWRLSAVLDAPVGIDQHEISGSFTIGASVYPQDGADVDTLIANAEAALYRAKAEARGSIRFFEPAIDRQVREKRSLQQEIAQALEKNELELYFQPQAKTSGEVFGFEVLVRWQHPVRGMVPPGLFIPLAEETSLIGAIDGWVLREACREAASWRNPLSIAVNLSPVDFRRGDIAAMILSVLLETGLQPQRLEIEITEGVLFQDFERAIAILRKIKNLGVRIAMDDFGTGYSSLSYLQAFPFDKIKIDQTFIAKISKNSSAAAIIHAIVGLGRALALPVIAEGVETEEQLAFLAREGCSEVQGYLIGRPQPIARYRQVTTNFAGDFEAAALAS